MITTKTIKPDKKQLFKILLTIKYRVFFWLWLFLIFVFLGDYFFNTKDNGTSTFLFFVILFSTIITIRLWKFINSDKNKMHFIERYYEIDTDKISSFHIDGTSYTTPINNYKEVKRIKKGYLITFVDSRIWFLPFYAFNNYEDLNYFETEVADKINRNTYFNQNPIKNINVNFNFPDPPVKYSKKKRRYIKLGIIAVVLACLSPFIHTCVKYFPVSETGKYRYITLFNDSIRKDIDTTYSGKIGIKKNGNLFYHYNYCTVHEIPFNKKDTVYNIDFWELKDLSNADLNTIKFNKNVSLSDIKMGMCSEEDENKSLPHIESRIAFEFTNSKMDVNLDYGTEVYKTIDTINYKGFFGKVNIMSLTDKNGKTQMLLKYKYPKKTLFLLYKTKQSFIVIRVNCNHDEAINENVINFFNLK